jgi:hypothetical protein
MPEDLMPATAQDIQARVHELLLRTYPPGPPLERRCDRRYPYPHLVRLTPINSENQPSGECLTVVGKNLSERGMGFFHSGPIAHRRMIASFDAGGGRWLGLVVDVTWCRFICSGWYESGGRFLEAVPLAAPSRVSRANK